MSKKRAITIDELNQIVYEANLREEAIRNGTAPGVDHIREARMQSLREKYPEGLRAIIHPNRNGRRAKSRWDTLADSS